MPYVFLVLIVLLAGFIAWFLVGRETQRQEADPPPTVFDVDEAVTWIGDYLSPELQAEISYDEVRQIIGWNLMFMRSRGAISNGHTPQMTGPVVVGGPETAEFVFQQAQKAGFDLTVEQIHAVLSAQLAYLEFIGAVGTAADDGE